ARLSSVFRNGILLAKEAVAADLRAYQFLDGFHRRRDEARIARCDDDAALDALSREAQHAEPVRIDVRLDEARCDDRAMPAPQDDIPHDRGGGDLHLVDRLDSLLGKVRRDELAESLCQDQREIDDLA